MQNSNGDMKKRIILTILFIVTCGNLFSQNVQNKSENEMKVFEQTLIEHMKKIKTLQCAFVQEKTSTLFDDKNVSKGNLFYQSPNALRWEYTDPSVSTLILNGNDAALLGKNNEKLGNERVFKELGGIIISLINGNGIAKNKQFTTVFKETEDNQVQVELTPTQRRLKDYFNTIEIKIDIKTMLANEIILNEKSGDKTIISLTDKMVNVEIPSSVFIIK